LIIPFHSLSSHSLSERLDLGDDGLVGLQAHPLAEYYFVGDAKTTSTAAFKS
jgi:hypothetical protein